MFAKKPATLVSNRRFRLLPDARVILRRKSTDGRPSGRELKEREDEGKSVSTADRARRLSQQPLEERVSRGTDASHPRFPFRRYLLPSIIFLTDQPTKHTHRQTHAHARSPRRVGRAGSSRFAEHGCLRCSNGKHATEQRREAGANLKQNNESTRRREISDFRRANERERETEEGERTRARGGARRSSRDSRALLASPRGRVVVRIITRIIPTER